MNKTHANNGATVGYEAQRWRRDILNIAEGKREVLGLNFLMCIVKLNVGKDKGGLA